MIGSSVSSEPWFWPLVVAGVLHALLLWRIFRKSASDPASGDVTPVDDVGDDAVACRACGTVNDLGFRYCRDCGEVLPDDDGRAPGIGPAGRRSAF